MAIVTTLLPLALAIAAKLSADEVKAWLPWLTRQLVALAIRTLPKDQRERYGEEWLAHIVETPGDIGKFLVAIGLVFAGILISLEISGQTQTEASGGSLRSPGLPILGLLPDPESRSLSFITSAAINCSILVMVLYMSGAIKYIPLLGPANLLVH